MCTHFIAPKNSVATVLSVSAPDWDNGRDKWIVLDASCPLPLGTHLVADTLTLLYNSLRLRIYPVVFTSKDRRQWHPNNGFCLIRLPWWDQQKENTTKKKNTENKWKRVRENNKLKRNATERLDWSVDLTLGHFAFLLFTTTWLSYLSRCSQHSAPFIDTRVYKVPT